MTTCTETKCKALAVENTELAGRIESLDDENNDLYGQTELLAAEVRELRKLQVIGGVPVQHVHHACHAADVQPMSGGLVLCGACLSAGWVR